MRISKIIISSGYKSVIAFAPEDETQRGFDESTQSIARFRNFNVRTAEALRAAKTKMDLLKAQNSELQNQISQLQSKLQEVERVKSSSEESSQAEIARLTEQNIKLQRSNEDKDGRLEILSAEYRDHEEKIVNLERELSEISESNANLQKKVSSTVELNSQLEEHILLAKSEKEGVETELEKAKENISRLNQENESSEQSVNDFRAQVDELKKELQQKKDLISDKDAEHEIQMKELLGDSDNIEQFHQGQIELKKENEELRRGFEELSDKNTKLESDIADYLARIQDLEEDLRKYELSNTVKEDENVQLVAELEEVYITLGEKDREIKRLTEYNSELSREKYRVEGMLMQLNEQIRGLQTDSSEMDGLLEVFEKQVGDDDIRSPDSRLTGTHNVSGLSSTRSTGGIDI